MSVDESQVEAIFTTALEQGSPEQVTAFLDQACRGNERLRKRIEQMLRVRANLGSFLQAPAAGLLGMGEDTFAEAPGMVIGPYKLLEQIGEGGFGIVFMAEQTEPIRRKVALKVIKPGMDTRQVIARFDAERQALALMDHPNIARVLDAGCTRRPDGSTLAGRPYFVMELVRGMPITEYCDQEGLSTRERLELFVSVCHAAQHAHQKGIIHRDLKPSNVLVTLHDGTPVVKVIDFGIAKAIGEQLTEKTLFTNFAHMMGTPLYMSPEQTALSGLDIDTRVDIYSLGVLLYELLTGTTPFDKERFKTVGYEEIRRIIRDEEPPTPSTRLSKMRSAQRGVRNARTTPHSALRIPNLQDLDWIVMKCLEKDRNRRYETANNLALDLQRYMADEPVQACPPSAGYRIRKFARRHKGLLAAGVGAALVLIVLMAGLVVHNIRITRERDGKQLALDAADAQRRRAEANLKHSLDAISGMLDLTERHLATLPQAEGIREKFLQAALESCQRIGDAEGGDTAARSLTARAYTLVGRIKSNLGHQVEAEQALRRALDLFANLAEEHPNDAQLQADLAASQFSLGVYLRTRGEAQEAETLLLQSVRLWKQVLADPVGKPGQQRQLAYALQELGYLHWSLERHREAEDSYQEALTLLREVHTAFPKEGDATRWLQASLHNSLGVLLRTSGRLPEAEQAFRQALQFSNAQEDRSRLHLGVVLWMMGRMEEAQRHQREAVRLCKIGVSQFPKGTGRRMELALTYRWLGLLLFSIGLTQEAEQTLQEALQIQEALVKEFPDETTYQERLAGTRRYLGNLLRDTARWPEAETAYRAALAFHESQAEKKGIAADDLAGLALTCEDFGNLLAAMGRSQEARPYFDKTRHGLRQALQLQGERYTLHDNLARFLATCPDTEFRDPGRALESAKKAVELAPQVGSCWTTLGIAHYRMGRWQESSEAQQKAIELRAGGDCTDWFFLAMARWQLGEKEEARKWCDRALQWMEQNMPQDEELRRLRAEAAELIGRADPVQP